ncbi:hypothetical protein SDC9_59554 [bioreactor metagenome]|uniref:NAD-specific glutamate dehydrogenase n=1 Tax=bioreactor metagenome TaxID=1076179 RepID=A0A644XAR5_9ZZZZ
MMIRAGRKSVHPRRGRGRARTWAARSGQGRSPDQPGRAWDRRRGKRASPLTYRDGGATRADPWGRGSLLGGGVLGLAALGGLAVGAAAATRGAVGRGLLGLTVALGLLVRVLRLGIGGLGLLDHRGKGQLAAVVDLGDLDLDLLADLDDVLDVLHPLATVQLTQLGDVQQAVLAREQGDERAEVDDLDDGAEVALADLGHRRVGDGVDHRAGGLGGLAGGRTDVDGAVVLDRDVRAGVLLHLVDHLALRADDLTDLVDRHVHGDDPRGVRAHLVRLADRLTHHLEQGHPGFLGLQQRLGQLLGRDAVELGVELQRGDEVTGAGDLEVHVTQRVLSAEDVGQRDVLGLAVDLLAHQAHRDAGHRGAQRHAGVQQRQGGGADRAHRGGAVGAERLRDLADGVRELLLAREDRHQGALGERTVADLATLRGADPAGLTGGVRREVVVVHVALGVLRRQRVDLLLHLEHVQRGDTQDLGLAALEERRTVHPGDDLDVGGQRADVPHTAAVDPDALGEGTVPDDLLLHRLEGGLDLGLAVGEGRGEGGDGLRLEGVLAVLAFQLGGDRHHLAHLVGDQLLDGRVDVVAVVGEDGELALLLRHLGRQAGLRVAQHLDERLGGLQALGDDLLGRGLLAGLDQVDHVLAATGLDHHHRDVTVGQHPAGDDHLEGGLGVLLHGREADPVVADQRDADAADRAGEGQAGDLGGH